MGTDVVSLFPSLSAERTGAAIRKQVEKSSMLWEEIDEQWLSLYVRLNRERCHEYSEIEHLCPVRRRGRRGREAGMGPLECDKRYLDIEDSESNWDWPNLPLNREQIKILLGRAMEIAVKFFFSHFTYTFGGEIFIQMFGGPIGARVMMCLARIVMQQWREDFVNLLKNIRNK